MQSANQRKPEKILSSYYLSPIARGLGDMIVSLPALQGLISTGVPTYLVMRSCAQRGLSSRIQGLSGAFDESQFDPLTLDEKDKYFNLREHKLQTEYIWGSQEFASAYPNYLIQDIVSQISFDMGIPQNSGACTPLLYKPAPEASGKAVFIPGSAGSMKCWPAQYWLELADYFKNEGIESVVIGQRDKCKVVNEVCILGLKYIETPELEYALDVVSNAKIVVGVDTGLSHLAVNQGIPTIMLFRFNSIFRRVFDHVVSFMAPECLPQCLIREFAENFNSNIDFRQEESFNKISYWETWHCAEERDDKRCMSRIEVSQVAKAAMKLLDRVVKPLH